MGLLNREKTKRKPLPPYTVLRCPANGHQVTWCRGFCQPIDGTGLCGRAAPHGLRSHFQDAIARYNERASRSAS